jgi:hypothetical protein
MSVALRKRLNECNGDVSPEATGQIRDGGPRVSVKSDNVSLPWRRYR